MFFLREFWIDQHLENLFGFPSWIDLHAHELVSNGQLILQDKSSCFTPNLLHLHEKSVVIDCCAAPVRKNKNKSFFLPLRKLIQF